MKPYVILAALMAVTALSGCAAAVGAGAVVITDEVMERRDGDDGLI